MNSELWTTRCLICLVPVRAEPPLTAAGLCRQDEDSLNNKLCTFTTTQKEYVPQHWYHCHTCGMLDSVGVCSVCVRVCHKGHDVTYAKNGSFFCDCGAKEDNSCQVRAPPALSLGRLGVALGWGTE